MGKKAKIPYHVLIAAKGGDPDAMEKILRHYDWLINQSSKRTVPDEYGNTITKIDLEIKQRIAAPALPRIISALTFWNR